MQLILVQPELGYVGADNIAAITTLLDSADFDIGSEDVLLLPEHYDMRTERARYESGVRELAARFGCNVVGGSHHEDRGGRLVNRGIAVAPNGDLLGEYEKLRPYAAERGIVDAGSSPGELVVAGKRVLVLICADFWFSDLFERATMLPDLVLVPALSVTRKPSPDYSRALWRHLAIARAYEFGCFIGISDWKYPSSLPRGFASGVGGFADPTTTSPEAFFAPIGEKCIRAYSVMFDALDAFRLDRTERGFFWKKPRAG